MIHSLIFDRSYYENNENRLCFVCNSVEIDYHCWDCHKVICAECLAASATLFCSCDCFLFKKNFECGKLLCWRCMFQIESIKVYHGFDARSHASNYLNSRYSYKCFYGLLKQIFRNPQLDADDPIPPIIRILNDFSDANIKWTRFKLLSGIESYIKNNKYSQLFAMVMFELAKCDLKNNNYIIDDEE